MTAISPKTQMLEQFALVAKALGQANRLDLLELLAQGERSVDALAQATGLTLANTSQHLLHLRRAGLITSEKRGLYVFYSLAGDDVIALLRPGLTGATYRAGCCKSRPWRARYPGGYDPFSLQDLHAQSVPSGA